MAIQSKYKFVVPAPSIAEATEPPNSEPGHEEPRAPRRGRVQELNGIFLHFCVECGRFAASVMASVCAMAKWGSGIAATIVRSNLMPQTKFRKLISLKGTQGRIMRAAVGDVARSVRWEPRWICCSLKRFQLISARDKSTGESK